MRYRRRRGSQKTDAMALEGLSAELRSFLALGNLCAAAAVISGVKQERVLWLDEALAQMAVLHQCELSAAEAMVALLPLLQQQLDNDISEQVLPIFEAVKLPVFQQTILWHRLGNFLLSQHQEQLAGHYFSKAQKQLSKREKLRQAIADRAPKGKAYLDWRSVTDEDKALSLERARSYRAVADYYLDTTRQLDAVDYVDQLSDFSRQLAQKL